MPLFQKKNKRVVNIQPLDKQIKWPDGVAVKTESGIWFIKSGKKFKCFSDRTAKSWSFYTIPATDKSISHIKKAGILGFRDGTLIKDIGHGKIYLVSASKLRHITDPDIIDIFGGNVIDVSGDEIKIHEFGEELNVFL